MGERYEADVLEWSEQQARLLRQRAAGEPGNEAPDWTNIAEEIEAVGRSERHAVEGNLIMALLHMLKAEAWPLSGEVPHWQAEARGFRRTAARRCTASMRNRIDMADLYADALYRMPDSIDGQPPLSVPAPCPVTLAELLEVEAYCGSLG